MYYVPQLGVSWPILIKLSSFRRGLIKKKEKKKTLSDFVRSPLENWISQVCSFLIFVINCPFTIEFFVLPIMTIRSCNDLLME